MLGAALLPFSSEQSLWVTFKCDTAAEESLRGSALNATESWGLCMEQEGPEEDLKQVPFSCREPSWVSLAIPCHQKPAIKSKKAISGKQRDNLLSVF